MKTIFLKNRTILLAMLLFLSPPMVELHAQSQNARKAGFVNHIKTFNKIEIRRQEANKYLSELSDKNFFLLAEEISKESNSTESYGFIKGHLKKRWVNDGPPMNIIQEEIKEKQRDKNYREMIIDDVTYHFTKKVRKEYSDNHIIGEAFDVINLYKDIVADKNDDKEVRIKAVYGFTVIVDILNEKKIITAIQTTEYGDFFLDRLTDPTEEEKIKGGSIKALRILDDKRVIPIIRNIISNLQSQELFLSRVAVVTAAKMNDAEAIDLISRQLALTNNKKLFETGVYALSLYDNPSTLKCILESRHRFDPDITKLLLRNQRNSIARVFQEGDKSFFVDAIKAVHFAELLEMKKYLIALLTDPDREVRLATIETLFEIGKQEDLITIIENTKNEDDSDIMVLLSKVKIKSKLIFKQPERSLEPTGMEKEGKDD